MYIDERGLSLRRQPGAGCDQSRHRAASSGAGIVPTIREEVPPGDGAAARGSLLRCVPTL